MILWAFDVDGTLQGAGGPIPIHVLEVLAAGGDRVVIASPSRTIDPPSISRYAPLLMPRWRILARLKDGIAAERYIYVGNLESDYLAAQRAGWEFVPTPDFLAWLSSSP